MSLAKTYFILQRMGVLIASEQHVWVLQQLVADHIAESVIFLEIETNRFKQEPFLSSTKPVLIQVNCQPRLL